MALKREDLAKALKGFNTTKKNKTQLDLGKIARGFRAGTAKLAETEDLDAGIDALLKTVDKSIAVLGDDKRSQRCLP